jgi:hypothetical protein
MQARCQVAPVASVCQHLYFCTSKARKLSTSGSPFPRCACIFLSAFVLLYGQSTSKAGKLSRTCIFFDCCSAGEGASGCVTSLRYTSAYVSIRQYTSAYVSMRQCGRRCVGLHGVSEVRRKHTSAYVSMRGVSEVHAKPHASAYVSIRLKVADRRRTRL